MAGPRRTAAAVGLSLTRLGRVAIATAHGSRSWAFDRTRVDAMSRRLVGAVGVALLASASSGCHLLCDRYCEREQTHCERMLNNRGGCYAPAPVPAACPPGCAPVAPGTYYGGQQY